MGAMGSRMAGALLRAGHAVTVWNRNPEKTLPLTQAGACAALTPSAAVVDAEFVIGMVRDDDASRRVWLDANDGALAALPTYAVAIESSTISAAWVKSLAQSCRERNIGFLDAPVAGSRPQAESTQLIYFIGGERNTLEKAEPILKAMGGTLWHVGPSGHGAIMKLVVNSLFGVQVAAVAELISFLQRSGLDVDRAVEILVSTPVCSPAARAAAGAILAHNVTTYFPIELVCKDFSYAMAAAGSVGANLPIAQEANAVYSEAVARGYGGDNITGVAQLYLSVSSPDLVKIRS
jgi:3-hydroxyisobutyrate dehydrogenase-like beta-hydroxyacid dehydrogenase